MVQNTRGIHNLPTKMAVISVSNEKGLCSKSIRLYLHISSCDFVDETWFPNIGEATD